MNKKKTIRQNGNTGLNKDNALTKRTGHNPRRLEKREKKSKQH